MTCNINPFQTHLNDAGQLAPDFLIIVFISICHDNGVVQHKLQKMFASKIYIQEMLSLKKTCYDWQTIRGP